MSAPQYSRFSRPENLFQGDSFPINRGSGGDVLAYDLARAVAKQVADGRVGSSWDFCLEPCFTCECSGARAIRSKAMMFLPAAFSSSAVAEP